MPPPRRHATDPIEAAFAGQAPLLRDKVVGRGTLQWVMGIPIGLSLMTVIVGAVMAAVGPAGSATAGLAMAAGGAGLGGMLTALWLTLSVLRTAVSRDALHVRAGLWGPDVPIEAIESARVVPEAGRVRVAGKRHEGGMWTTSFQMHSGAFVEVIHRTADGERARLQVSATDPHALVAAIERARAPRTRIADEGAEAATRSERDALAEEEAALAEAEAEERART